MKCILFACLFLITINVAALGQGAATCTLTATLKDASGNPKKDERITLVQSQKSGEAMVRSEIESSRSAADGTVSLQIPNNAVIWVYAPVNVGSTNLAINGPFGVKFTISSSDNPCIISLESLGANVSAPTQGLTVYDESTPLAGLFGTFKFAGAGVTAARTAAGITTITIPGGGASGLTPNRAMQTDGSGNASASGVTATELTYLTGATSAIQPQLNAKAIAARLINTQSGELTGGGDLSADRTLGLASVITPGSCTNCNLTYDAKGRITIAANGAGGGVASFNGRTGAVNPATNDYSFAQIGSPPTTLGGYGITDAQPLDATLTALAGLNSTAGLVEEISADNFTKRAIGVAAGTSIPTRADADARYAAISHTHAESEITNLVSDLAGKAAASHTHTEADVTNLVSDLASKAPNLRTITPGNGLQGGGDLSANRAIDLKLNASGGLSKTLGTGSDELGIASGGVSNAMLAGSIAYSKLVLTGAILSADLAGSVDATKIADGSVTSAEFQRINSVTSNVQDQLDAKAAASHTHAATDITSGQLALARGGSHADLSATGPGYLKQATLGADVTVGAIAAGDMPSAIDAAKLADGSVSNAEFQRLDGVTSGIQSQLDGKQASGNYLTALTGDGTASGPSGGGSAALTLATVNGNVGSFGGASQAVSVTANAKGLITAISAQAIAIAASQITSGNFVANVAVNGPLTGGSSGSNAASLTLGLDVSVDHAFTAAQSITRSLAAGATGDGLSLINPASATSGNQRKSPSFHWTGAGFRTGTGGASETVEAIAYLSPIQGVSHPTSNLQIDFAVNGGSFFNQFAFSSNGVFSANQATFTSSNSIALGLSGIFPGQAIFYNATSGSVTLQPVTGALGAAVISLPAATGSVALGPTAGPVSFTGPTATRAYALPDADATILTSNAAVTAAQGGTGGDSSGATGVAHVSGGTWSYSTIVNADVSGSAAIAYSKLALTGAILNADLAGSIAYSKLALTGAILNADLAGSIALSKLANQADQTIVGNTSGGSAAPVALTATQATAILNAFTGDSGSGGIKGLVPAPASGDAAASKVLGAGGTWVAQSGGTTINSTDTAIPYRSNSTTFANTPLFRESANVLAQRNSTNSQTVYIYDTYTSATNYERVGIGVGPQGSSGQPTIFQEAGTAGGTPRPLSIQGGSPPASGGTANQVGAALNLLGGVSTGNVNGGSVNIQLSPAGSSGAFANTPITYASFNLTDGGLRIGTASSVNGRLAFANSTNNNVATIVATAITGARTITVNDADATFIQPSSAVSNQFMTGISSTGAVTRAQPAFADLSGTASAAQLPGSFNGFANPTASVGLSAVNGSAATAMRSDAAPALSQSIAPTWTGVHTFTPMARSSGVAAYLTVTTPADTALTAGTEAIGLNFTAATRQHASNTTVATQRERVFDAPTYSFATSGGTITDAINTDFVDPVAGTNATLSNIYSLRAGNVKLTGAVVTSGLVTKTTSGNVTLAGTDYILVVNKSSGQATTVTLPSSPTTGRMIVIKDGKGDSSSNPITINPASGNVDGASSFVISIPYAVVTFVYNGSEWSVL